MRLKLLDCPRCGAEVTEEIAFLQPNHVIRCAGTCHGFFVLEEKDMPGIFELIAKEHPEGTA